MMDIQQILVVIDPTTENQRALTRAADLARRLDAELILFLCDNIRELGYSPFDSPFTSEASERKGRESFLQRKQRELEELANPLRNQGLKVRAEVVWGKRFYDEVTRKCLRSRVDLVVKTTEHHSKLRRTFFSGSDWHMIRECPAPILLVKLDEMPDKPQLIVAVDPMQEYEVPVQFDHKIMQCGILLRDKLGASLNVLHWYESPYLPASEDAIPGEYKQAHEAKLNELLADYDVPADKVYLRPGENEKALIDLVSALPASIVIMGAIARDHLERLVIGTTAEKVLDRLPCDILVLKPDGFVSPVALAS